MKCVRIVFPLLLSAVSTACSHTTRLNINGPQEHLDAANSVTSKRIVNVRSTDGSSVALRAVTISRDSITGFVPDGNAYRWFATRDVAELKYTSATRGMLDGTLLGVLTGAILGFVSYSEPEGCWVFCLSRGETAVFLGVAGSIPGFLIGTFAGARVTYRIVMEATTAELASGHRR